MGTRRRKALNRGKPNAVPFLNLEQGAFSECLEHVLTADLDVAEIMDNVELPEDISENKKEKPTVRDRINSHEKFLSRLFAKTMRALDLPEHVSTRKGKCPGTVKLAGITRACKSLVCPSCYSRSVTLFHNKIKSKWVQEGYRLVVVSTNNKLVAGKVEQEYALAQKLTKRLRGIVTPWSRWVFSTCHIVSRKNREVGLSCTVVAIVPNTYANACISCLYQYKGLRDGDIMTPRHWVDLDEYLIRAFRYSIAINLKENQQVVEEIMRFSAQKPKHNAPTKGGKFNEKTKDIARGKSRNTGGRYAKEGDEGCREDGGETEESS